MPLTPPVTPAQVEQIGALTFSLFRLADQPSLDTFVQGALDFADAWMQAHMGSNYGLTQFPWQVTLQSRGQIYLALEALTDTLKAEKIYGTHFPYMSEDSASYEKLIDNEWGVKAMQSLDLWVTVETGTTHFALPLFLTSVPLIENEWQNTALDPLSVLYSELLDRARGMSNPDIGSIRA
jgi:hypothetical protein